MVTPWMQTSTGKKFPFLDCSPGDICIEDIARGLSNECRWGRQANPFYSVAQHSVLLSLVVPFHLSWYALFHDAHEAYIGDCPRPLKKLSAFGREYEKVADRIQNAVEEKFDVVPMNYPEFHAWDNRMGLTEMKILMSGDVSKDEGFLMEGEPLEIRITPWRPERAYDRFLQRFHELSR